MDIIVSQHHLVKALANASRVATQKTGLPALANVLLRTDGAQLVIEATNLEIALRERISAKINTPGKVTIPARLVHEYVQNLPNENITIKEVGTQVEISAGSYVSKFNTISSEEFPELPVITDDGATEITLKSQECKQAISQVIIAASTDASRPVLTGVYCHTHDGSLFFVATDGYRLAEREVQKTDSSINVIIPSTTLQELQRVIDDTDDNLVVTYDENQICFQSGDIQLTSRFIDGTFPDYRQLIPTSNSVQFAVEKDNLQRIVKIANLFAREGGSGITMSVSSEDGTATIASTASEKGENTSTIDVKNSGEDGVISFNARYLNDSLQVIDAKEITIRFSGKLSPITVASTSTKQRYTHIIMPLKS